MITYPHPLLRQKMEFDPSIDYHDLYLKLRDEADAESLKHNENGYDVVGLAANQIGVETRAFLFRSAPWKYSGSRPKYAFAIDPVVVWADSRTTVETEGCGSLPGYFTEVERPSSIAVGFRGIRLKADMEVVMLYDEYARFFLHELDHLDGILIFDRVPEYWRPAESAIAISERSSY